MELLVEHLKAHFLRLEDPMRAFARCGVQVEGWFKGELLGALCGLKDRGDIADFDREVRCSSHRVDLQVKSSVTHWIELKHWLIGKQNGVEYGPRFYFQDSTSVGIRLDVKKLLDLHGEARRWLLLLLTANPGEKAWQEGVDGFNAKFSPYHLEPRTDPSQFPASFFLGLLYVGQRAAA